MPNTVQGPMIVGSQRSSPPPPPPRTAPRRPKSTVNAAVGRPPPRDPSEDRTQLEKQSLVLTPRAPTVQPADNTSAKLLVIASVMSLVVVVLSIAVLSKTTGSQTVQAEAPVKIETAPRPPASPAPSKQAAADLMLSLDVEPKDASLVVQPTQEGFSVKVAASGYQTETRTIEKGVTGKIAVKLAPAPKQKASAKKKKVVTKKTAKKKPAKKGTPDGEVFLTGSDL
jgi:hypothetical protein